MNKSLTRLFYMLTVSAILLSLVGLKTASASAVFTVNSTADAVDIHPGDGVCATAAGTCTLRAAIQETNALGGSNTINLPAGTYTLTIAGANESYAATGDLDIRNNLTVLGAGSGVTLINANKLDRAFHVWSGSSLILSGATI